MTGDGIRLALASAELAAAVAAQVLDGTLGATSAFRHYHRALRQRRGRKQAFNRVMRGLVSSPRAVSLAARAARAWPGLLRAAIRYAGDAPAIRA
jgi:flavin-dependent dehydrogenase